MSIMCRRCRVLGSCTVIVGEKCFCERLPRLRLVPSPLPVLCHTTHHITHHTHGSDGISEFASLSISRIGRTLFHLRDCLVTRTTLLHEDDGRVSLHIRVNAELSGPLDALHRLYKRRGWSHASVPSKEKNKKGRAEKESRRGRRNETHEISQEAYLEVEVGARACKGLRSDLILRRERLAVWTLS